MHYSTTLPRPATPELLENLLRIEPDVWVLDNGLTVVFQHEPSNPLFSAQVWIRSGSIHEGRLEGAGLSHFLEHMVFKGSENHAAGSIASAVQRFGGQLNAYTSFDRTVYYIDGPSEAFAEALDLLCELTLKATLPDAEFERERAVILREIDMTQDDPERTLSRALFATAYREHPFRHPVIGHRMLFEQLQAQDLLGYYKARYNPANMVLSVVGDVQKEAVCELLQENFASRARGFLAPVMVPQEPVQLAYRERIIKGDYSLARGTVGFKIPSMRDPRSVGLDVLAAIIGSGYSGTLRRILRDEAGLVHHIGATAWNPGEPGLFWIPFHCDPDKTEAVQELLQQTLEGFTSKPFELREIEKAQRFAIVSEVQSRQTVSGLAARLGLLTALVGDPAYPRRYFQLLAELTPEYLLQLAHATFNRHQSSAVVMLPESWQAASTARQRNAVAENFQEKTLANGARIIWQQDARLPRLHLRVCSLGGPAYENPGQEGATSLLATLLTKDTEHRSAADISRMLEFSGGFFHENSGNNTFFLSMDLMPDHQVEGLQLLSEAILSPAFRETTFAREQAAQIAALHEQQDEILEVARRSMRQHFFGTHPLAIDAMGSVQSVERLSPGDMRALRSRLQVGPNTVAVITGDFDPQEILPRLQQCLLALPKSEFKPVLPSFTAPATSGSITETMPREQAVVLQAYPCPGFGSDKELLVEVLDELLSDMSGPLFNNVREQKGLAYFVGAASLLSANGGAFYLYAGTHPDQVDDVYAALDEEIERLQRGDIDAGNVAAACQRLKVQSRFQLQSAGARASKVALNAILGKPLMDWLDLDSKLAAIDCAAIQSFAVELFDRSRQLRYCLTPQLSAEPTAAVPVDETMQSH